MQAHGELGPRLPSRVDVYMQAAALLRLAELARECAAPGRASDLPRALRQFERMRAILGSGLGSGPTPGDSGRGPEAGQ